jgi:hypothetical protein
VKAIPLRALAAACIVAAGFCLVSAIIALSLAPTNPGSRDFIEYWAAEQLLIHHANPYDRVATFQIERAAGFTKGRAEFWYSPPVDLLLALPLGFVGARSGLILWTIALFAGLSLSLWLIWDLNGRPNTLLSLAGFLFAPALTCLLAGQISIFFLLAFVLFLYFYESHPFWAGAALLPCTLKLHLFLPFAVALLLWILVRKRYSILAGFAAAFTAGCVLTFSFDSHAWSEYSQLMKTEGLLNEFVPTLSETLRFQIDRSAIWLQFVPGVLACCWAVWYFWTRRDRWNWMNHGLLLLLVSALCRPYGWFFDESVLLPAVLAGMYRAANSRWSLLPLGLIAGVALIEALIPVPITSPYYLWTAPAWLAWYLYATRGSGAPAGKSAQPSP